MQEKEQNFAIIKSRIMQIPDILGITKAEFYKKIEVSPSNYNGKSRFSEITADVLHKISMTYSEISIDWLVTGNGPMLKLSKDEQDIEMLACIPNNNKYRQIPFVEQSAIAGFGSADFSLSSQDVKSSYIIPKFKDCKIDFMIEIRGSSMYPKYSSGDVIACTIIKESNFIQWNKVHLIATREQGLLVKRLKKASTPDKITAVSDNPDYDPFEIPKEEITGIALVVGVIRLE